MPISDPHGPPGGSMGRETVRIGTMMGASWIHIVGFVLLVAGPSVVVASPNGPPASRTSAPAIGGIGAESSCTGCHGGNPVNSGGSIALTGAPAYYTPGQLYTITRPRGRSNGRRRPGARDRLPSISRAWPPTVRTAPTSTMSTPDRFRLRT